MFKYLVVLACLAVFAMAAPPAPEGAPRDLDAASQLYYTAGYPTVYSAGAVGYGYPYAAYGGYRPVVYGR